jgi:Recombinase
MRLGSVQLTSVAVCAPGNNASLAMCGGGRTCRGLPGGRAPLVARVIAGEREMDLVRDLNQRGITSPLGAKWRIGNLKQLLMRKRYVIFDATGHPTDCPCLANSEGNGTLVHREVVCELAPAASCAFCRMPGAHQRPRLNLPRTVSCETISLWLRHTPPRPTS